MAEYLEADDDLLYDAYKKAYDTAEATAEATEEEEL